MGRNGAGGHAASAVADAAGALVCKDPGWPPVALRAGLRAGGRAAPRPGSGEPPADAGPPSRPRVCVSHVNSRVTAVCATDANTKSGGCPALRGSRPAWPPRLWDARGQGGHRGRGCTVPQRARTCGGTAIRRLGPTHAATEREGADGDPQGTVTLRARCPGEGPQRPAAGVSCSSGTAATSSEASCASPTRESHLISVFNVCGTKTYVKPAFLPLRSVLLRYSHLILHAGAFGGLVHGSRHRTHLSVGLPGHRWPQEGARCLPAAPSHAHRSRCAAEARHPSGRPSECVGDWVIG